MRFRSLLQCAITMTWILLLLVGCGMSPKRSTVSPSATPADEQPTTSPTPKTIVMEEKTIVEICPCESCVNVEAWIDQNENGKREPEEKPLPGVTFIADTLSRKRAVRAISDTTGLAVIMVRGCDCNYPFTVYPEVPPGYKLTTQRQLSNTVCSQDEEWDRRCRLGTCSFGFVAPPGTPQSLREADLHGADLRGVNLNDANLNSANLSAANLNGADLGNAKLHKARYDRNTKWPEGFDPVAAGAVLEE